MLQKLTKNYFSVKTKKLKCKLVLEADEFYSILVDKVVYPYIFQAKNNRKSEA